MLLQFTNGNSNGSPKIIFMFSACTIRLVGLGYYLALSSLENSN
jgi:hypothetical protein